MKALTYLQRRHWDFIVACYEEHGRVPSYEEFQDEFGYSSTNSVFQHLKNLVTKGYLVKLGRGRYEIHPTKHSQLSGIHLGIPIKGRIAAGGMHEAISEDLGHLPVELHPGKGAHYFALRVAGDSMIEADIRDGDYIILDPKPPKDGEIGAVLYNGETTLKTVRKKTGGVVLEPANPAYEPIHIEPDEWEEVTVFGTYVGKAWKTGGQWGLIFRAG